MQAMPMPINKYEFSTRILFDTVALTHTTSLFKALNAFELQFLLIKDITILLHIAILDKHKIV